MTKKSDHVEDLDDPKYDAQDDSGLSDAEETPAPKPGDPDYDWSPHYPEGTNLFRYVYPSGAVIEMHQFEDIYSKQWLRSIRDAPTEFDVESAAIDRGACTLAQEVIDSIPAPIGEPDPFQLLWDAWKTSGTDRGDGKGLSTGE